MKTCGAIHEILGDQSGDYVSVTCGLPKGHSEQHMEVFGPPGARVTVLWTNAEAPQPPALNQRES